MPTETFFNLDREKQDNLIKALKREFSRVPLNEASISNIIKTANISRGSFYQYFADKEDAFYHLLEEHSRLNKEEFISLLKQENGDLFATFSVLFEKMLHEFQVKEHRDFFKNIFLNLNYKMRKTLSLEMNEAVPHSSFEEALEYIDFDVLNADTKEEAMHITHILVGVMFQNFAFSFARQQTIEEALEHYKMDMDLLKKGMAK